MSEPLNVLKQQYLEWLLTPKAERNPASKRAFAESIGRSPWTLRDWEKGEAFKKALTDGVWEVAGGQDSILEAVQELKRAALDSKSPKQAQMMKMYLEYLNLLKPQATVQVTNNLDASKLSNDELNALIAEAAVAEAASRTQEAA